MSPAPSSESHGPCLAKPYPAEAGSSCLSATGTANECGNPKLSLDACESGSALPTRRRNTDQRDVLLSVFDNDGHKRISEGAPSDQRCGATSVAGDKDRLPKTHVIRPMVAQTFRCIDPAALGPTYAMVFSARLRTDVELTNARCSSEPSTPKASSSSEERQLQQRPSPASILATIYSRSQHSTNSSPHQLTNKYAPTHPAKAATHIATGLAGAADTVRVARHHRRTALPLSPLLTSGPMTAHGDLRIASSRSGPPVDLRCHCAQTRCSSALTAG
ncbi:hypothetical protein OPT61_g7826 [Boeremia exigua]|uniref:Uncharacterized protein n=1 Tax=Boeremia exigua TaxID=749465 RepID=A0ACC2I0R0_9PLEO|nr:hypothetical protein OPT61_g7826 [Boeremia exigua]